MAETTTGQESFPISRSFLTFALLVSSYFFNVRAQDGPISGEQIIGTNFGQLGTINGTYKVTTSLEMDILKNSYPPSAGAFRDEISIPLMLPILQFISSTASYVFINPYPYFAWAADSNVVSINYALFATGADQVIVIDGSYTYTNLLDAQIDALIAAMESINCGGTNIAIGETGWPSNGDAGQPGANLKSAATYDRRLVRKAIANPDLHLHFLQ